MRTGVVSTNQKRTVQRWCREHTVSSDVGNRPTCRQNHLFDNTATMIVDPTSGKTAQHKHRLSSAAQIWENNLTHIAKITHGEQQQDSDSDEPCGSLKGLDRLEDACSCAHVFLHLKHWPADNCMGKAKNRLIKGESSFNNSLWEKVGRRKVRNEQDQTRTSDLGDNLSAKAGYN